MLLIILPFSLIVNRFLEIYSKVFTFLYGRGRSASPVWNFTLLILTLSQFFNKCGNFVADARQLVDKFLGSHS